MISIMINNFKHNIKILLRDNIFIFLLICWIFYCIMSLLGFKVVHTNSHSDVDGYYFISSNFFNKSLKVNDYAAYCLNDDVALGYAISFGLNTDNGECKRNSKPLLKHVCAKAGDKIKLVDDFLYINNKKTLINYKFNDNIYNKIDWLSKKEFTVPDKYYFMCGKSELSYDSRYYGFISESDLVGRAYLLF